MEVCNAYKLIHQLEKAPSGCDVRLLLVQNTREYCLEISIYDKDCYPANLPVVLSHLVTVYNYYQRLITPPIVAAPQIELAANTQVVIQKRSAPGLGKLNGRSRLTIRSAGDAPIVGGLFNNLCKREAGNISRLIADIH